jgi:hypothetical protein
MPEGITESLTTYLLRGLTPAAIAQIQMMDTDYFQCSKRTGYGILVSKLEPPTAATVVRRLPGNNLDLVKGWLLRNSVEVLIDEHRRTMPGEGARISAVAGWKESRAVRDTLEAELREIVLRRAVLVEKIDEAKMRESLAAEEILRTHGKTMVMIDGVVWEARAFRAGVVFERKD